MNKISGLIIILALLAVSCIIDGGGPENNTPGSSGGSPKDYPINNAPPALTEKKFWAQDNKDGKFYQFDAVCKAWNTVCEVWVEKSNSSKVADAQAKAVADKYSKNIYDKLMNVFGSTYEFTDINMIMNTMQLADYLTDGNGRLIILLLDIKDDYVPPNGAYVAGYFWAGDFYENDTPIGNTGNVITGSNECDMIYMDINPLEVGSEVFYETLAHETQHLMNFVTTNILRKSVMDTWIDEGLSSAAEYVYSGNVSQERITHYNNDGTGLIAKGDNFFVWGNRNNENPNAILNDYATVNLFFQWLRVKWSTSIYRAVFNSSYSDYNAISELQLFTDAAGKPTKVNWPNLFLMWHAANYIQSSDINSLYGYSNESHLKTIKQKYCNGVTSINLYPGEAVYSYSATQQSLSKFSSISNDIAYIGIKTSLDFTNVPSGGALLTFNINTNIKGTPQSGTLTGETKTNIISQTKNIQSSGNNNTQAYRIDAGDLRRRNGLAEFSFTNELPVVKTADASRSLQNTSSLSFKIIDNVDVQLPKYSVNMND